MAPRSSNSAGTSLRRALRTALLEAERVDAAVYEAVTQTPTPSLDAGMRRLTQAANYSRLSLGSAVVLAASRGSTGRRAAVRGLASVALSSAVANLVIKPLGERRRPDPSGMRRSRRAPMPGSSSFPSGHSASAFAFATGVASLLPCEAVPLRGLAALVAYSRVHTGVHYPGDVIAGAFLGTTVAQIACRTFDRQRWPLTG
jgi:membrane-associated phospholipid phosphatase